MYKFIMCLWLILLPFILKGQDLVTIQNELFLIRYSQMLEQPVYVEYKVTPNYIGNVSRRGMDFWSPSNIHTSDDDDYYENIWDKGHMVPAGSFNKDKQMLYKTFNYVNSSLQHESLNRGVWSDVEQLERDLCYLFDSVNVEIRPMFSQSSLKLSTGAVVPDGFYKTLKFGGRELRLYIGNYDTRYTIWSDYIIR